MIELRNVTKAYPVKNALRYVLRDVSVVIPARTNVAVLGPNGAGKSTFLRLIGGAESADSGTIISDSEISWPLGLTTGFQGSLTGRQNVLFVCRINGLNPSQCQEVIRQVTDFAEIGEYFDMPVNTYSSGMRGRLSFGLSMAFDFDVYLVDELTSVGDAIFREKAKAAFERIRKRASLIYVSHNLSSLRESCQTALFLRDGHVDFYPDIDEGIAAYTEYIREHRNHGDPKTFPKIRATKRVRKKFAAKKTGVAQTSGDEQVPFSESGQQTQAGGHLPGKRARKRVAKKAVRKKARPVPTSGDGNEPSSGAEPQARGGSQFQRKRAKKRAAKKVARKKARPVPTSGDEQLPLSGVEPQTQIGNPFPRKRTRKRAAKKVARKKIRPAHENQGSLNPDSPSKHSDDSNLHPHTEQ
jgi:capsular polysaccharide transport system ATP-binding protein